MALAKWLMGGLAGAAVGAVIWILVSYYLNAEVGYVAWGIGILTGLGVRLASRYDDTPPSGIESIVAATIALLTLLAAKFLVISIQIDEMVAGANAVLENGENAALDLNQIKLEAFIGSFGLFDLLWVFLAVSSAYQIAREDEAATASGE